MEVAIVVLQLLLVIVFSMTSIRKIAGIEMDQRALSKHEHRIAVGFMEMVAVICLLLGFYYETLVMYGALMLVVLAIGRIRTHLRVTQTFREQLPTIFGGVFALILLFLVVS
ncbi:DoxX family protein [Lysinibacillus sp. KU-BSD001]|uniref:DoxX family protein n=1 Tax=Lysinibacillus sp. KU-BSD001 TaxID=3141328 RepID=UPI0036EBF499